MEERYAGTGRRGAGGDPADGKYLKRAVPEAVREGPAL